MRSESKAVLGTQRLPFFSLVNGWMKLSSEPHLSQGREWVGSKFAVQFKDNISSPVQGSHSAKQ